MQFRRFVAIGRMWIPLLIGSVLLAAGAAFVFSNTQPKVFESKATLIVGQSLSGLSPDYTQLLASQRLSTTYASIATHRPRLQAVIKELGLNVTPEELGKRVVALAPIDSTLITITVQGPDAEQAAAIANAVANELIATSPAIEGPEAKLQASIGADLDATQAQVTATQARIEELTAKPDLTSPESTELATLEGRLVTLRSTYATLLSFLSGSSSNLLTVSEPAIAAASPVSPRPLLNTLLAVIFGLLIAVGIVVVAEYVRDAVRDPEDIEAATGLNTLGTIGRMKGNHARREFYHLAALLYPRSGVAEAYRKLRTNLEFSSLEVPIQTLLVTSARQGEGKTVTAANLAIVFAQTGRRVLLVDADLRKPGIHLLFDLPNSKGLTTLVGRSGTPAESVVQSTTQVNLEVLTTGPLPPNPAELLGSQRMRVVVESLKTGYELVVVDSPPIQAVADTAILSSYIDGVLFVVDTTRSRRRAIHQARGALHRARANVLGAVLNRAPVGLQAEYSESYGGEYVAEVVPGSVAGQSGGTGGAGERSAT